MNEVNVIQEAWGLRDYGTEPLIFDGTCDCEHEWGEDIIKKQSGGTANATVGNQIDTRTHYESKTNFCVKCGAWRGQLGLEPTPELFIKHLLDFFDDVKLKLKNDGNCFVNLGDTYGSGSGGGDTKSEKQISNEGSLIKRKNTISKCLLMIPQRFAWGMIERGWILRNEIIWSKPNHMPESVTDRLTKAHEVIYHFVKQGKYYYNLDAIREKPTEPIRKTNRINDYHSKDKESGTHYMGGINEYRLKKRQNGEPECHPLGKNPGDVWNITTQPYPESHFAVFPLELVRRPILAGCPPQGTVLDPFGGSGTVGEFCRHNDRNAILFELNPAYKPLIEDRAMLNISELSEWG